MVEENRGSCVDKIGSCVLYEKFTMMMGRVCFMEGSVGRLDKIRYIAQNHGRD